jgi:hypothetical protein
MGQLSSLFWSIDFLHALLVVLVCTMPDLLLQWISSLMAASRVMSLVVTLLSVTVVALYLLHLAVLANVLILGSTPPLLLAGALGVLVLAGAALGRRLASGF